MSRPLHALLAAVTALPFALATAAGQCSAALMKSMARRDGSVFAAAMAGGPRNSQGPSALTVCSFCSSGSDDARLRDISN